MRLSLVFALSLCSIPSVAQVSVVEPATRAILVDGHTAISLALNSRASTALDTRITLQWLSPDGHVDGTAQRDFSVPPGDSAVSIPFPLCSKCDALVERLDYHAFPTSRNYTAFPPISGRVSLPHIADYVFTLGVLTAGFPVPNQPFELRVLAAHPVTAQPVPGVKVASGEVTAFTGADGIALLRVTRA
jgi:hypothetical protein